MYLGARHSVADLEEERGGVLECNAPIRQETFIVF